MDDKTTQVLRLIQSHLKIKKYLTVLCYLSLISGLFVYVFYALNKTTHSIKLVNQYDKNSDDFKIEKIMTNPRLNLQYDENQIYHIKAKKAHHEDNEEVLLYDVFATGDIGNITSGQLKVSQQGDHLVFTENPVLILNRTDNLSDDKKNSKKPIPTKTKND